jgi:hypothetical protein
VNIAKQKDIVALKREVSNLKDEFNSAQSANVTQNIERFLGDAIEQFKDYLSAEGFNFTNSPGVTLTASSEGVFIKLQHYVTYFEVKMPNQEVYRVTVKTALEYSTENYTGDNQDEEISHLKKQISKLNSLLDEVDNQIFYYELTKEIRRGPGVRNREEKEKYRSFDHILGVMFS